MRYFRVVILAIITAGLIWFLDAVRVKQVPLAAGRFLDPFHGFWQNMEPEQPKWANELELSELKGTVTVHYDERRVAHIFAENDHDLYFAQGFVTARDRLWQMEFQTHAAAGRLSEIIDDERVLRLDRLRRRTGMVAAAETSLRAVEKNPEYLAVSEAYTAGVNAYINGLHYKQLPLEYKLLDYRPEPWSNLKTCILLKLMAWDLTGSSDDFEQLNAREAYGEAEYARLFTPINDSVYPIIPRGSSYPFAAKPAPAPANYTPTALLGKLEYPKPSKELGSNNWAVSGSKTASGKTILCNDPHLGLRLPSLWYEIQLTTPEHSVYGVSLPGSPCVIIGFNENVAWGVTNASRDVMDWYKIEFHDANRESYRHGGTRLPTKKRIEEIKIRGKASFTDTVVYTHHGPVVFDKDFGDVDSIGPVDVAMRWAAADSSLEIRTLFLLNRAKTHADYQEALKSFYCPGQNFIFASKSGDIAITQNGRFPNKWPTQGEFILDGTDPAHDWQGFIPMDQNPHALNPKEGFIFSSNQVPTDANYPYTVAGNYDFTRNRRIYQALDGMKKITVEDMENLQNDNHHVRAAEFMPMMIAKMDTSLLEEGAREKLATLRSWNYLCDPELEAPGVYEYWETTLMEAIWADEAKAAGKYLDRPSTYLTLHYALREGNLSFVDDKGTAPVETLAELLAVSLNKANMQIEDYERNEDLSAIWQNVNNVRVVHLTRQEAFSFYHIATGGNANVVNANRQNNGASWRMIVEMGETPNGWGVYPGGQSGNPGSRVYANGIPVWAKGEYFRLNFLKRGEAPKEIVKSTQTLKGVKP
jgi:penicillin amidase